MTLVNLAGGDILSAVYGTGGGVTLRDAGYIAAPGGYAIKFSGTGNRLVLSPGASFGNGGQGDIYGGSGNDTLELAGGNGIGSLATGLLAGFDTIAIDAGAAWTLAAYTEIASGTTLGNSGTLIAGGRLRDDGLLTNTGTILADPQGLVLMNGIAFTNAADGTISSAGIALSGYHTENSVTNDGLLIGTGTAGIGVVLLGSNTLVNFGTIIGQSGTAVYIAPGGDGRVIAEAGAAFDGAVVGSGRAETLELTQGVTLNLQKTDIFDVTVQIDAGATLITGAANIIGTGDVIAAADGSGVGISLTAGQALTIQSGATLLGSVTGSLGGTIVEYGSITGAGAAAVSFSGGGNRLVLHEGAAFGSMVTAGSQDVLELAAGPQPGGLTGFGTSITGFGTVLVDPGASWTLAYADGAANTIANGVTLIDDGHLNLNGRLAIDGELLAGGYVTNGFGYAVTGNITLTGGGTLNGLTLDGEVTGFGNDNTVDGGIILGANGTAVALAGTGDLVVFGQGVTFDGTVSVGGGTLELFSPSGTADFTGLGAKFGGFDTLQVDAAQFGPGAWALTGPNTLKAGGVIDGAGTLLVLGTLLADGGTIATAALVNDGTLTETAGLPMRVTDSITGTGRINVSGGTLELDGSIASGQTIALQNDGTLLLGDGAGFQGKIIGFGAGEVVGLVAASANGTNTIAGNFLGQTITGGHLHR